MALLTRRRLFSCTVVGIFLAICLIFAAVMRDAYEDVGRSTSLSAANLAATVAHDVDRNIELLDLSLQAVTNIWSNPTVQALASPVRDLVLFDNALKAQGFGGINVLDATGMVVATSIPVGLSSLSFADRDYFLVHRGSDNLGLFVSQPFLSRISGGWTIGLSRRLNKPDGTFGGVVVGTLRLSYLDSLYSGVNLGRDGTAALLRTDGTIVTRTPFTESDIRRNVRNTDAFTQIRSARAGSIEGLSPLDGRRRIISFHRVGNLPLIQDVELSADEAYTNWRRKTFVLGGLLLILCIASLSLLVLLELELARRVQAEKRLEHLANTDALTGLANRRQFEKVLAQEWRRALRAESDLALLMIDADLFKSYNDANGHPAGDKLLKEIANCIAGSVHRPGDLPARVGGEEFAILLPDTDEAGGLAVGETIRRAICALDHPHPRSAKGIATVSAGVACLRPRHGQAEHDLVAAADAALYRAKDEGRNCVRANPQPRRINLVA